MDPQRYARVKEVFREAMRWAPEEQAAVVAELAGDDAGLRDEVMSLLGHHDEAPLIREPAHNVVRAAEALAAKTASMPAAAAASVKEAAVAAEVPATATAAAAAAAAAAATAAAVAAEVPATAAAATAAAAEAPRQTLAELLRAERAGGAAAGWPLERVIRMLEPVAEALAAAADRGDVHGAIRAERIVVAEVGGERVAALADSSADAGDAGLRGTDTATRIESAEAAAAAPEQISPTLGPTGPWTDVYSLALLCVELMLGRPPVKGTAVAVLARVRDEAAQPTPRAVGLEVPAAVEAVMTMALAMRPMERYQDVRRFWTALRESLVARPAPVPAAASGSLSAAASSASSSRSSLSSSRSSASSSRSSSFAGSPAERRWRPRISWAAAAVIIAVAAGVIIAVQRCG